MINRNEGVALSRTVECWYCGDKGNGNATLLEDLTKQGH
jgi:hypothetical protein